MMKDEGNNEEVVKLDYISFRFTTSLLLPLSSKSKIKTVQYFSGVKALVVAICAMIQGVQPYWFHLV